MPSKNPPAKLTAKPAQPARPAKPTLSVKEFQELRTAEQQAETEASERTEHRGMMGAVAIEPESAPEKSAPSGNQAAPAPARRKATKWLREKAWLHLAKQAKFPLAKRDDDEGLVLFSAEEEGEHYVYVTHRLHGEHREDEVSRMVDQYQAVLEQHGMQAERVMKDLRTSVRLHVTRTDDEAKQTVVRKPATSTKRRTVQRLADDDQDQTGDGMGI